MGLIILTLLGLKYLPGWVKLVWLFQRILGESFKVITVDKSAVEYYRKLSELTAQIHKIGVLYNQTVRAINSYHSVKTAQILLEKLAKLSAQIIALQEQAISLTIDYRKK